MNKNIVIATKNCRVCGLSGLEKVFSLGDLYTSAFIEESEQGELEKYPLTLVLCNAKNGGCGLLQLEHTVPNEILYRNYWYRSGTNQTMTDELFDIVRVIRGLVPISKNDVVLDIGCNDGTLLRAYDGGAIRVGFEPAKNLVSAASVNADKVINEFFNADAYRKEFPDKKAKAITAIAMFYDLDDPNKFVADIAGCLDKDGVFVVQMSYLPLMLSQNAFDNICHEHLEYYSLTSLEKLLDRHNLEVFDVELNDVNGGSFRIFMKHKDGGKNLNIPVAAADRVKKMSADEEALGLNDARVYKDFADRVLGLRKKTVDFIKSETEKGKKIYAYGASTKGNTLLQFYGLDAALIPFAVERSQYKWGKRTVGSLIPIISEELARSEKPDYFLVLPWHFLKEFREREKEFFAGGGKFIVPLPQFEILSS